MTIRHAAPADFASVLKVHRAAFAGDDVAELTAALLKDPTARPTISLLAEDDGDVVGHILFTRACVDGPEEHTLATLLAPLGVMPEAQGRGVGGQLVRAGIEAAGSSGVQLVFVLGYPDYYPRFGFVPAGVLGLEAPYPIPEKNAGAWMVLETVPGVLRRVSGTVRPAEALRDPAHWRE